VTDLVTPAVRCSMPIAKKGLAWLLRIGIVPMTERLI
jgi:hypothetical protein